ncbi:serine protease, partial [Planctomycetota bacterium]
MCRKNLSLLLILLSAGLFFCGCNTTQTIDESEIILLKNNSNYDPNAIVLLVHLGQQQQQAFVSLPRVAFTIGDGTIIITAAHCLEAPSNWSNEPMSSEIIAVSPYYGDAFNCQILTVDKDADIAVLKAPWPGHPALAIASPDELNAAGQVTVFSRPIAKPQDPYQLGRQIRASTIELDRINQDNPKAGIVLKGTGPVKRGWSGSAIVIPESAKVAGVISSVSGIGFRVPKIISIGVIFNALGSNVQSIWQLLEKNDLQYRAKSYFPEKFESVKQSGPAFSDFMEYFEALFNDDENQAYETADKLLAIRPESAYANLFYALSTDKLAHTLDSDSPALFVQALDGYERAVELNPQSAHLHTIYSNFLINHRLNMKTLEHTES